MCEHVCREDRGEKPQDEITSSLGRINRADAKGAGNGLAQHTGAVASIGLVTETAERSRETRFPRTRASPVEGLKARFGVQDKDK